MTLEQKKNFIHQLVSVTENKIIKKADKMPEAWDGHEIRKYIADTFQGIIMGSYMLNKKCSRYKQYIQDCYSL